MATHDSTPPDLPSPATEATPASEDRKPTKSRSKRKSTRRSRSVGSPMKLFTLRVHPAEKRVWADAAKLRGMELSAFIRESTNRAATGNDELPLQLPLRPVVSHRQLSLPARPQNDNQLQIPGAADE